MDTHKTYCKPFMETGYCGYGNTCKYLHIRKGDESICSICESIFQSKVKTECGHYFCFECIYQFYMKNGTCFNCKKEINGGFYIENSDL